MRRQIKVLLIGAAALLLAPPEANASKVASIFNFQANGIFVFNNAANGTIGSSNTFSGQIAWTPILDIGLLAVRGELGFTILKNGLHNTFLASNAEVRLSLPIFPNVAIEGGGGMHTWTDLNGGTNPAITGMVVVGLPGMIDRVFAGYTRVFMTNPANEIRAGIGFEI